MVSRGLAVVCAFAACAAGQRPPAAGGPAAPPAGAAVISHEETGDRLYISDFASGRLEPIGPAGEEPHQPVWSPDGLRLAWRVGEDIWLHGGPSDLRVAEHVEIEIRWPCAFSPDGRALAVAGRGRVDLIAPGLPRELVSRPDLRVGDLLWSPDGGTLIVLFWAPGSPGHSVGEVVRVTLADRTTKSQRADDVSRLLGWRPNRDLLAVASAEGREQPAILGPSGPRLLRTLAEDLSVLDYAAATDQLLLAASGEDTGDDAVIFLAPVDGAAPPRRWLASHPKLSQLRLSNDGAWALFVDRSAGAEGRPGGSVYLASVGRENARLVLRATAARSYSDPTPRPGPRRR